MTLTTCHNATAILVCSGDVEHSCPVPNVCGYGATGPVECAECGSPMALCDLILVQSSTTLSWASLDGEARKYARRYWS